MGYNLEEEEEYISLQSNNTMISITNLIDTVLVERLTTSTFSVGTKEELATNEGL